MLPDHGYTVFDRTGDLAKVATHASIINYIKPMLSGVFCKCHGNSLVGGIFTGRIAATVMNTAILISAGDGFVVQVQILPVCQEVLTYSFVKCVYRYSGNLTCALQVVIDV